MQRMEALSVLTEARDLIAAELPTLQGAVALQTKDLLNRVDRLLAGYFD